MHLAKQHLDIGLFTMDLAKQVMFWQHKVGLVFDHMIKVGDGVHQHRFHANGSIIKINHCRQSLPSTPASGITGVHLASKAVAGRTDLSDPDGNRLVLVPPGLGLSGLAVEMKVSDLAVASRFWGETLQFPSPAANTFQIGDSLVLLQEGPRAAQPQTTWRAQGWRYLTIQVLDCREEHERALARGAVEAEAPRDFGGIAVVSFIRDPDGNFIEISERMSLKRAHSA